MVFKQKTSVVKVHFQENKANIIFGSFAIRPYVNIAYEYGKKHISLEIKDMKKNTPYWELSVEKNELFSTYYNACKLPQQIQDFAFKVANTITKSDYQEPRELPKYFYQNY